MHVLTARNVHEALPLGIDYLQNHGVRRDSRNGPVYQSPVPVTTVYERPYERVCFWPERDANPFFHLYESLWMLAGRNDLAPLLRFSKQIGAYSDDGRTMNGSAYGYRWRKVFDPVDQLEVVAETLTRNKDDRRCMLQMWDASTDLGSSSKDVPCNTMATLQINTEGALDLSVFCRSNDIIWGAYGANAVHFSVLLEYMANWIGVPVGRYYQISINWHGYLNTFEPMKELTPLSPWFPGDNPYESKVRPMLLPKMPVKEIDFQIGFLLGMVDTSFYGFEEPGAVNFDASFFQTTFKLLLAHHIWKTNNAPLRFEKSLEIIGGCDQSLDWVVASKEWVERRYDKWKETK